MGERSIPRVEGYDVARESAAMGVEAFVGWRVQAERALLLVHDVQEYFMRPYGGEEPLPTMIRNIDRLRSQARALSVPTVYSVQEPARNAAERGLLRAFWGPGMGADPGDAKVVSSLAPLEGDVVLRKVKYSAFFRTNLEQVLRRSGRDQLLICGVYADIGCLVTATDALMRDIEAFLIADAVAAFSADQHGWALRHARGTCAEVMDTASVLTALDGTKSQRVAGSAGSVAEGRLR